MIYLLAGARTKSCSIDVGRPESWSHSGSTARVGWCSVTGSGLGPLWSCGAHWERKWISVSTSGDASLARTENHWAYGSVSGSASRG